MNILPARIGPTVCELLGPTDFDGKQVVVSKMSHRNPEHLPPILKRSKVEMTACSGLSTPDSVSLLSGTSCESAMYLAGEGLKGTICDLNREEEHGQRAIR
jgi:hypothetical protein